MEATKFEIGKSYGNDLTVEVLKRTAKTITIKSTFGEQRIKVREYMPGVEAIDFKAWYITANETFDKEKARQISYEKAYYS